jgi:hypothetical protein
MTSVLGERAHSLQKVHLGVHRETDSGSATVAVLQHASRSLTAFDCASGGTSVIDRLNQFIAMRQDSYSEPDHDCPNHLR